MISSCVQQKTAEPIMYSCKEKGFITDSIKVILLNFKSGHESVLPTTLPILLIITLRICGDLALYHLTDAISPASLLFLKCMTLTGPKACLCGLCLECSFVRYLHFPYTFIKYKMSNEAASGHLIKNRRSPPESLQYFFLLNIFTFSINIKLFLAYPWIKLEDLWT